MKMSSTRSLRRRWLGGDLCNQDQKAVVEQDLAKTSCKYSPVCIQPVTLVSGMETIGEVEVPDYLDRLHNKSSKSILVADSLSLNWVEKGVIAGSINILWTK